MHIFKNIHEKRRFGVFNKFKEFKKIASNKFLQAVKVRWVLNSVREKWISCYTRRKNIPTFIPQLNGNTMR
jgi:hypothetical protein